MRTPRSNIAAQERDFFTVGSTKDEVLAVQGTPTEFTDRAWKYGLSSVYFADDHVTSWRISPLNPLRARMLPSGRIAPLAAFFTAGSTKDEVLAVQGTPTEFTDRAWKYGLSSVYFADDRVISWRISPLNQLKARLLPAGPTPERAFFTVGSTKDEVLAVQGTPTEFTDRAWKYGLSSVYFENDRVTSWRISPLNPLKARLLSVKE